MEASTKASKSSHNIYQSKVQLEILSKHLSHNSIMEA